MEYFDHRCFKKCKAEEHQIVKERKGFDQYSRNICTEYKLDKFTNCAKEDLIWAKGIHYDDFKETDYCAVKVNTEKITCSKWCGSYGLKCYAG